MGHTIDLVGEKFGRLLVLSKTDKRDVSGNVVWMCLCECGNIAEIRTSNLKNSHAQSCGCLAKEVNGKRVFKDLTSKRFGLLKVVDFAGFNKHGKAVWWCKCACGSLKRVWSNALTTGATISCGCYHSEVVSNMRGEKHYKWRGGFSEKDYPEEWSDSLKEFIRNRDGRICKYPNCNYDDTKEIKRLSVHHIDGNKKNCRHTNLISLCNRHHQLIENNHPELWIDKFYAYTESFCV